MRINPMPGSDSDSMCSMPLTVVEYERSLMITIRRSIPIGESPG